MSYIDAFAKSPKLRGILVEIFTRAILKAWTVAEEDRVWGEYIKTVDDSGAEETLRAKIVSLFGEQADEVLENMRTIPEIAGEASIDAWMFSIAVWEAKFAAAELDPLAEAMMANANRVIADLNVGAGISFDLENPYVKDLLTQRTILFSATVVGTTETDIRKTLAEGISQGETFKELQQRVRDTFADASKDRADLIAKNETIWASNAGAEAVYKMSGVVERKEWLVAADERLCPWCKEMGRRFGPGTNGIPVGDTFLGLGSVLSIDEEDGSSKSIKISYEPIYHPPLHPRCRCTLIPVIKEL